MKLKYESPELEIYKFDLSVKVLLVSTTYENTGDENTADGDKNGDPFE